MALVGNELLSVVGIQTNGQPSSVFEQTTTGAIANLALINSSYEKNTAITTVGNGTLTAAAIEGGLITRSGSVANFTDTTDTAVNIIAAITNATIGQSFEFTIINTTAFQETLSAGTGVTLTGTTVISGNSVGRFLLTYTGAGAVSIYGLWSVDRGIDNFSATTDPVVGSDNTQGYGVGSIWFNTTLNRSWECISAATGAAIWGFSGAAYSNGGANPPNEVTQFGSSTALMSAEGNINRQISAAGVAPGATGADNVLAVFSLPASALDGLAATNRILTVTAEGSFGATANNKRIKLFFNPATAVVGSTVGAGGTLLADSGVVATNTGGWLVSGNIIKYGSVGSNTQLCTSNGSINGGTHNGITAPTLATAIESSPILIAVTGNATTATSDILFNWLEVNAMN